MVLTSVQWFQSNLESDLSVHGPVKFSLYMLRASILCILRMSVTPQSYQHHSDRIQATDSSLSFKCIHFHPEYFFLNLNVLKASKSKQQLASHLISKCCFSSLPSKKQIQPPCIILENDDYPLNCMNCVSLLQFVLTTMR